MEMEEGMKLSLQCEVHVEYLERGVGTKLGVGSRMDPRTRQYKQNPQCVMATEYQQGLGPCPAYYLHICSSLLFHEQSPVLIHFFKKTSLIS